MTTRVGVGVRVVHLGRSTYHVISGRGDKSTRVPTHLPWSRRGYLRFSQGGGLTPPAPQSRFPSVEKSTAGRQRYHRVGRGMLCLQGDLDCRGKASDARALSLSLTLSFCLSICLSVCLAVSLSLSISLSFSMATSAAAQPSKLSTLDAKPPTLSLSLTL